MARFEYLSRNGTRTILRINIDNSLNVKQKINAHSNKEHMSHSDSNSC